MSLADKIEVNTRYTRSTNVERDRGSRSIIEAYLPTTGGNTGGWDSSTCIKQ